MTELELINNYFNCANYIALGQLYLKDNPLLKTSLKRSDIKEKIVGHWGTVPSQNFIYTHLNRVINKYNLNMFYISGPGHGGNAMIAQDFIDGSYTKMYPDIQQNEEGLKKLFKRFSYPGGVSSHVSPEVPGSIHEGGELGYSLSHAYGAVLDNPDLICACVIGDGEAETGSLATSWNYNKFLNVKNDGVVLPIINLNGYKIANPTVLARMSNEDLINLFTGLGYHPYIIEDDMIMNMHNAMALALDKIIGEILFIKKYNTDSFAKWPMLIVKTKKGLTCPTVYNNKPIENTFRAHQVPFQIESDEDIILLENWLKSYGIDNFFNPDGTFTEDIIKMIPKHPMGENEVTNPKGYKELMLPSIYDYENKIERGVTKLSDMMELSKYIRDVFSLNNNFRIFGPDEALSNRLNHVFEKENRIWGMNIYENDEYLAKDGKVLDSYLSENFCEGALEGYILTGRYGILHSYEAFARIIDSMAGQHAKWLKMCNNIGWRNDIPSLNYILTSHAWQQDHNGYTHQDPGFISHMANKKDEITAVYMPLDSNMLLVCLNESLKTKNKINIITSSKHPSIQWLTLSEALDLFNKKAGELPFVIENNPDLVLSCSGDTPTLETIAAYQILKKYYPSLKIRIVNVVNLMCLKPEDDETLSDEEYDNLFTKDKPIIFNFHGYPGLIESLTYKRYNHNLSVHGYIEEGTITTAFDMRVLNKIDRFHIVLDALDHLNIKDSECQKYCLDMLDKHNSYIKEHGIDLEEIINWNYRM